MGERRLLRREDGTKALRPLCPAGAVVAVEECKDPWQRKWGTLSRALQVKKTTLAFTLVKVGWYRKVLNREGTSSGTGLAGTYGYGGERSLQGSLTHRVHCDLLWHVPSHSLRTRMGMCDLLIANKTGQRGWEATPSTAYNTQQD